MLKVCFCAKQVDGLTASRQILTSKKDSIKPPILHFALEFMEFVVINIYSTK
jgi:hypothetical protein